MTFSVQTKAILYTHLYNIYINILNGASFLKIIINYGNPFGTLIFVQTLQVRNL